ncbi:MAG TPA: ferritin-like domain-containing protein [Gemmatimonadales bacterium]|jgi:ABC-type antimicrobial peptide transport system permease subunit
MSRTDLTGEPAPLTPELDFLGKVASATSRRTFLKWAGVTIGVAAVAGAGACSSDDNMTTPPPTGTDLGSGDVGLLNYAYALEQLEAAFYTQVVANPYTGMTSAETTMLTDIRDHEVTHRDFLKAALGGSAIGALSVNFTSINFTSRASVLGAAKTFEDLGVSAYNGAAKLFSISTNGTTYLGLAGKIVSVEARHAAAIRDVLNPLSADFAGDDVVDSNGLDVVNTPSTVLNSTHAGAYVTTKITYSNLPNGGTQ